MGTFGDFLTTLGNLHDCTITALDWKPDLRRMLFEIDDIYSNFKGFPEYKGPKRETITLEDVHSVEGEVNKFEVPLHIYDFSLTHEGSDISRALVLFWPAGKIEITFGRVTFPHI